MKLLKKVKRILITVRIYEDYKERASVSMEKSGGGTQTPPYFLTLVQTIIYSIIHPITNPINHHLNLTNHHSIIKSPFSPAITFTPFAPNLTKSIDIVFRRPSLTGLLFFLLALLISTLTPLTRLL